MISPNDNQPIILQGELNLTEKQMSSEACNGRYYSYEKHEWQSMGWIEWVVRKVFAGLIDSVQTRCLGHSWKAIEQMPTIPADIKDKIEDFFLDSLLPTNPRASYSGVISRVFCRIHSEKNFTNGSSLNQIDIQQHDTERSFGVFYDKNLKYLVVNSSYGQLDFYLPNEDKVFSNQYDSLWTMDQSRIGSTKLAVDYPRQASTIELNSGKDLPLAKIEQNKEKISLAFREATTNRLFAVANLTEFKRQINWKITIIDQEILDQNKINPILLAWTSLKYSQHHHFPDPAMLKYVSKQPQTQVFRD